MNAGRTWIFDLLGDANLHAMMPVGDDLYAAETTDRIWHVDSDGT